MQQGVEAAIVAERLSAEALAEAVAVLRRQAAAGGEPVAAVAEARDWDAEAAALRQQLELAEERVVAAKRRVQERQQTCAVAERLEQLVALYLSPGASPQELAERVAADAPLLEGSKAFRMVREKVVAASASRSGGGGESSGGSKEAAVSPAVAEALVQMREQLEAEGALEKTSRIGNVPVLRAAAECAERLARLESPEEREQLRRGARLLLAGRFAREPDIPLFAALHHNALAALGPSLEPAARAQLRACAERVRRGLRAHLEEAEEAMAAAGEAEEGRRRAAAAQTRAVKRCAHELGLLRRAWSEALPAERASAETGRLADEVLEWLVQRALGAGDLSVAESAALGASVRESLALLAGALGLSPAASETEKRAAAPAWPRARRAGEMLAGTPLAALEPRLSALLACFSAAELRLLVEAIYEDNAVRASLLNKL